MLAAVLTSAASWNSEQPLLTYIVPDELQAELRQGQLVAIPYGERLVEGIVWHIHNDERASQQCPRGWPDDIMLRPLAAILDPEPALLPHQRALAEWMAEYYVTPLAPDRADDAAAGPDAAFAGRAATGESEPWKIDATAAAECIAAPAGPDRPAAERWRVRC